jgi:hypothetical protein
MNTQSKKLPKTVGKSEIAGDSWVEFPETYSDWDANQTAIIKPAVLHPSTELFDDKPSFQAKSQLLCRIHSINLDRSGQTIQ